MKKIIGLINSFFGIIQLTLGLFYLFITMPRLQNMYANLDVETEVNISYPYLAILIFLGIVNIFVALANFNLILKDKSDLMYKLGIFMAIGSFIFTGLATGFLINSTITPIYVFTKSL
ncbi:hypothetical protein ACFL13_01275 [Patescibacteria group bacterium]